MAYATVVDPGLRLGMVRARGAVTGLDLLAANEALYSNPDWRPGFDELWDCLGIEEFDVRLDEIRAVVEMEVEEQDRVGDGRVAIVMTRDVVEMIGRLYQVLVEDAERPVELVRTLADGAAWLGLAGVPDWLSAPSDPPAHDTDGG